MDELNPKIQAALAECRQAMASQLLNEAKLTAENRELREMLLLRLPPDAVMSYLQDQDPNTWKQECMMMQNSLSWRITKPLRLIKKVAVSFKTMGIRYTIKKIFRRL